MSKEPWSIFRPGPIVVVKVIFLKYCPFEDAGFAFLTRSTIKTSETISWEDGKDYPLVKLEDYSFASKGKTFHIAENMGMLKYKFYKLDIPFELIAPSSVKKYATGKGNSNKESMIEAFRETAGFDLLSELDCTYNSPASDIADSYFICKYQSENPLK